MDNCQCENRWKYSLHQIICSQIFVGKIDPLLSLLQMEQLHPVMNNLLTGIVLMKLTREIILAKSFTLWNLIYSRVLNLSEQLIVKTSANFPSSFFGNFLYFWELFR